jgi:hypothetical protein
MRTFVGHPWTDSDFAAKSPSSAYSGKEPDVQLLPELGQVFAPPGIEHRHELKTSGRCELSVKTLQTRKFFHATLATHGREVQEVELARFVHKKDLVILGLKR